MLQAGIIDHTPYFPSPVSFVGSTTELAALNSPPRHRTARMYCRRGVVERFRPHWPCVCKLATADPEDTSRSPHPPQENHMPRSVSTAEPRISDPRQLPTTMAEF